MAPMTWLLRRVRWVGLGLIVVIGAGTAFGSTPVGASALAQPLQLTPGVGSMQSTVVGTSFPIPLAITVTDAHNNPVAGVLVTFSAPVSGASGRFTVHAGGSHHRARPYTVRVKANARGIAVAPAFTADDTPGGYIVKAIVEHARPTAFALVNLAPGRPL